VSDWVKPKDLLELAKWHKKHSADNWHIEVCRAAAAELKRLRKLAKKREVTCERQ
jgi:hypothetical protein